MKLIDKAAVVAEINKLKGKVSDESSYCNGWQHALRMLEIELSTIKVKDVDLDFTKEVDAWVRDNGDTNGFFNVQELAKHFFELGLKAQKGEEV